MDQRGSNKATSRAQRERSGFQIRLRGGGHDWGMTEKGPFLLGKPTWLSKTKQVLLSRGQLKRTMFHGCGRRCLWGVAGPDEGAMQLGSYILVQRECRSRQSIT